MEKWWANNWTWVLSVLSMTVFQSGRLILENNNKPHKISPPPISTDSPRASTYSPPASTQLQPSNTLVNIGGLNIDDPIKFCTIIFNNPKVLATFQVQRPNVVGDCRNFLAAQQRPAPVQEISPPDPTCINAEYQNNRYKKALDDEWNSVINPGLHGNVDINKMMYDNDIVYYKDFYNQYGEFCSLPNYMPRH
jgi:hypothetical protein